MDWSIVMLHTFKHCKLIVYASSHKFRAWTPEVLRATLPNTRIVLRSLPTRRSWRRSLPCIGIPWSKQSCTPSACWYTSRDNSFHTQPFEHSCHRLEHKFGSDITKQENRNKLTILGQTLVIGDNEDEHESGEQYDSLNARHVGDCAVAGQVMLGVGACSAIYTALLCLQVCVSEWDGLQGVCTLFNWFMAWPALPFSPTRVLLILSLWLWSLSLLYTVSRFENRMINT